VALLLTDLADEMELAISSILPAEKPPAEETKPNEEIPFPSPDILLPDDSIIS
jgi:hypothetical protein